MFIEADYRNEKSTMKSIKSVSKRFPLLLGVLLLVFGQSLMAMPRAFQANYTVSKGSMKLGYLNSTLKYAGNRYSYHKYTKATGLAALITGIKIIENSDGQFSGDTIKPLTYLFNQSKRGGGKVDKIQFLGNRATGSYKNKPFNLAITPDTQDKASLELSLARDVAKNKGKLSYPVVGRGEKTQYAFQKIGNETLKTNAGTFNALKVKVVRSTNKRETLFWLAKELDYMPVKVRHREKDDVITTVIDNYKLL